MKKFLILLAALFALSTVLTACAPAVQGTAGTEPATIPSPAVSDTPAETPMASETPAATPDLNDIEKNMDAMTPILDSIVRTMGIGEDSRYTPQDAEFFWRVLYLMGLNWGYDNPQAELTDAYVVVSPQKMREFASAAFLDYNELSNVPERLSASIWYDEEKDAYCLAHSDAGGGGVQTRVDAFDVAENGAITARMGLYDGPDIFLGAIEFTLVANPCLGAAGEPSYPYAVSAAVLAVSNLELKQ